MHGRISMDTSGPTSTLTKRAEGTGPRSRLAHEATVLAAVTHPGVVRYVDYRTGDERDELVTEFAGATTLADHRPTTLAGVAGLGAAIADTVADLHDMGLAHGALQADHVVLGARRRPVLCSLSAASYDEGVRPADVVALGEIVAELLDGVPQPRVGAERRARASVLDAATDAIEGNCDARELAGRLAAVPGARIDAGDEADRHAGDGADPDLAGTRTWRHRVVPLGSAPPTPSRRVLVAAGVALAVVVVALLAASGKRQGGNVEERLLGLAPPTALPAVGATATPLAGPPECPAGLDVDGDGCGDDTEVIGRLIRHGETWYEVGEPGDVVVLGHWSCAPVATPAVLRPATGELFVFDRWPSAETAVEVASAEVVLGASMLVLGQVDGCDVPIAEAS